MWDRKVPVNVEEEGVERFWEGGKEGEAERELDWWDDKEAGERHVTGVRMNYIYVATSGQIKYALRIQGLELQLCPS